MIDSMSKMGKINDIKHNNWSKINPQNQVILDCFMPSTSVQVSFLYGSLFLISIVVVSKKGFFYFS